MDRPCGRRASFDHGSYAAEIESPRLSKRPAVVGRHFSAQGQPGSFFDHFAVRLWSHGDGSANDLQSSSWGLEVSLVGFWSGQRFPAHLETVLKGIDFTTELGFSYFLAGD